MTSDTASFLPGLHGSLTTRQFLRQPTSALSLREGVRHTYRYIDHLVSALKARRLTRLRHIFSGISPLPSPRAHASLAPFVIVGSPSNHLRPPAFHPSQWQDSTIWGRQGMWKLFACCSWVACSFLRGFDRSSFGRRAETWCTGLSPGMQISCIMALTLSATFLPAAPPPAQTAPYILQTRTSLGHQNTLAPVAKCTP